MFRAELTRGLQFGGQQLGDLNGVQGRPLAQVVPRDEQCQPTAARYPRVLPDATDQGFVDAQRFLADVLNKPSLLSGYTQAGADAQAQGDPSLVRRSLFPT